MSDGWNDHAVARHPAAAPAANRLQRHVLSFVLFVSFVAPLSAAPPSIRVLAEPTLIEVSSTLPPSEIADEKHLTVALLDDATGQSGAPVFGDYTRTGQRLNFRPRFALTPGARYRITTGSEHLDHVIPARTAQAPSTVEGVFPACEEVPANILKFYLHFSRPMREGREVFTHIHLLDSTGESIPAPWRDTELWTEDARRLTLWIHPGRVKRGVNLREELGPVLQPGARYTLVIDADLRDATGQPLGREFRHVLYTTSEIHARLDLAAAVLESPRTGLREPLRVRFPLALDTPIARRCLHVRTAEGQAVRGQGTLLRDGRTFLFYPEKPWTSVPHRLDADPQLEDLAGNNFIRVFDDDVTLPANTTLPETTRGFTPR